MGRIGGKHCLDFKHTCKGFWSIEDLYDVSGPRKSYILYSIVTKKYVQNSNCSKEHGLMVPKPATKSAPTFNLFFKQSVTLGIV